MEEIKVIINKKGEVIFEVLTKQLEEIAIELDPFLQNALNLYLCG